MVILEFCLFELREQLFVCGGECKVSVIVGFHVCWLSCTCWSRTGPYFGMSSHWCRVLINVCNIDDRASPRGKGRIADEDSAPCGVQCLESERLPCIY